MNSGKSIVITGASRGIGAATARLAASHGYKVGVACRNNTGGAEQVVASIESLGGQAVVVQGELTDPAQVEELFVQVERKLGPIGGLVNNAGIPGGRTRFQDITTEQFRHVLEVNLLGTYHCIQAVIKRMARAHGGSGGSIVNVSSMAAQTGGDRLIPYVASKGAINALTIGLARELAPEGIRVNAVSPGVIRTDQNPIQNLEWLAEVKRTIPLGNLGTPEEVAEAIVWFLSDRSSYVTGTILPVSGGR